MKLGLDLFITNASCLHDVSQIREYMKIGQIFESERKGDREREKERDRAERELGCFKMR